MNDFCMARRRALAAAGALAVLAVPGAASAQAHSVHAIVVEAAGDKLAASPALFEAWRKAGLVQRAKVLKPLPGQKEAGFAHIVVVDLPSEQAFQRWRTEAAGQWASGVTIRQADLVWHAGTPSAKPVEAVHVASLYATHVARAPYTTYTEQYIAPNMALQRAAGILSQATMYLQREAAGGKGTSLLVMEYADHAAYERREPVKAAGKARLAADPAWKKIDDTKESIRTDISSTATTVLGAAAP